MPLYEYRCDECGDVFEIIQKFADEPLTVHEKCGGPVHRLISTSAFNFKGSGWYVTDYAKSKGGKTEDNGAKKADDSGAAAKTESKSESKGESKSESKGESKSESTKSETSSASGDKSASKSSDKKD